jgi:hypothetical protein
VAVKKRKALHLRGFFSRALLGKCATRKGETPSGASLLFQGCLHRGIRIERLRDPPTEWSHQFEVPGLNPEQPQHRLKIPNNGRPKAEISGTLTKKTSKESVVVLGVGRYREHSDEAF